MARISLSAHGGASPATAWERYADPRLWSTWAPHLAGVDLEPGSGPRLVAGLRGRVAPVVGPRLPFEVLSVDHHAMTWSWRVHLGPVGLHLVHDVRPRGAGSASGLVMRGPLAVVAPYAPLARWALARLVQP